MPAGKHPRPNSAGVVPKIGLRKLWKFQVTINECLGSPLPDPRAVPPCGRWLNGLFQARVQNLSEDVELLPRILRTINLQLVHFVLECCSLQSQALRRSALAGDSSGGGNQSIDNGLPLCLFETWRG